jgi:hypothetical protein
MADNELKFPGDLIAKRLELNLARQEQLEAYLRQHLRDLPVALSNAGAVVLRDLQADLQDVRAVVDKAIRQTESAAGEINTAAGHAAEANALLDKGEWLHYDLHDALTIIKNQRVWFESDAAVWAALLHLVEPAVFHTAYAALPAERQAALAAIECGGGTG